jgi:hypothetical protein
MTVEAEVHPVSSLLLAAVVGVYGQKALLPRGFAKDLRRTRAAWMVSVGGSSGMITLMPGLTGAPFPSQGC